MGFLLGEWLQAVSLFSPFSILSLGFQWKVSECHRSRSVKGRQGQKKQFYDLALWWWCTKVIWLLWMFISLRSIAMLPVLVSSVISQFWLMWSKSPLRQDDNFSKHRTRVIFKIPGTTMQHFQRTTPNMVAVRDYCLVYDLLVANSSIIPGQNLYLGLNF